MFKYSCLHFPSPCPTHSRLPPLILPPFALSLCPLYMFLDNPFPLFPHYPSPIRLWLLTVLYFSDVNLDSNYHRFTFFLQKWFLLSHYVDAS